MHAVIRGRARAEKQAGHWLELDIGHANWPRGRPSTVYAAQVELGAPRSAAWASVSASVSSSHASHASCTAHPAAHAMSGPPAIRNTDTLQPVLPAPFASRPPIDDLGI